MRIIITHVQTGMKWESVDLPEFTEDELNLYVKNIVTNKFTYVSIKTNIGKTFFSDNVLKDCVVEIVD